jgi:hypothetical protein
MILPSCGRMDLNSHLAQADLLSARAIQNAFDWYDVFRTSCMRDDLASKEVSSDGAGYGAQDACNESCIDIAKRSAAGNDFGGIGHWAEVRVETHVYAHLGIWIGEHDMVSMQHEPMMMYHQLM